MQGQDTPVLMVIKDSDGQVSGKILLKDSAVCVTRLMGFLKLLRCLALWLLNPLRSAMASTEPERRSFSLSTPSLRYNNPREFGVFAFLVLMCAAVVSAGVQMDRRQHVFHEGGHGLFSFWWRKVRLFYRNVSEMLSVVHTNVEEAEPELWGGASESFGCL